MITVVQLEPPHNHRINTSERDIQTFKNNFVAGLAPVDNIFPIYLWFQMVKQAEIKINLLITSRTNSRLSVYAQILGQFDFNPTPMVPPGTKYSHMKNQRNVKHGENTE